MKTRLIFLFAVATLVFGQTSNSGNLSNLSAISNAITAEAVIGNTKLIVGSGGARGAAESTLNAAVMKATAGVPSAAVAADVVGLWTACTGYLKNDGTCDAGGAGATDMTQAVENSADNSVSVGVGTSGRAFEKTPFTIDPATGDSSTPGTVSSGSGGTVAGELELYELGANGSNFRSWLAPDAITATLQLKHADGLPAGSVMTFPTPTGTVSQYSWTNYAEAATASTIPIRDASGHVNAAAEAYDATNWDGDTGVPQKDAVRDKIELLAPKADPVFTGSAQIPNGTGPTIDAAGEVGVDTTTDQFQFYGGAKRALPSIQYFSVTIAAPVATDDINLMKAPFAMTILGIDAIVQGTTSVTGQIQECDSAGANCADLDSDIVADADGAADDGSLTDSAIASGAWLRWNTTSISGTPTFLTVTVRYRVVPD